jgi:tape measure domain-containing protein
VAESLGSAVLTLTVDDSAYKAGLNAAKAQATSAANGIGAAFRNLAGVIGTVGLGVLVQQIASTGEASEKTKIQLEALAGAYGESARAGEAVARIQQVLGLSALSARESFSKLYGALRGTGIGLDQLEVLFVGINKAARLSGSGTQEASAALIQLKQGLSSGRLAGDELRSVLEQLPVFAQAIAKEMGTSVGQLRQLGSEGKITADIIFNAAKSLATATIPARAQAEQLGIAFTNLKEQIAAAVGPGIVNALAGLAAGIVTFAKLIEDNAGKIKGFVVATLALGRALAPFAAAILVVRSAMVAYQVAAKAAAVAQAAVLALQGPSGWAILAAGIVAATGAAVAIEKVMAGVAGQTEEARKAYEKYKKEFAGVVSSTSLEAPPGTEPNKDAVKAQKDIDINNLKLEGIKEQVKATNDLAAAERGVARETLASVQAIQFAISEAQRREREIGAQIDAARQLGQEENAQKLVSDQVVAANETRLELEKGALALAEAGEKLRDDIRTSVVEFTKVRSDPQGLNRFLNSQERQKRAEVDFQTLLPGFREAQARFERLTGARAPEFSGTTAGVNESIRNFIDSVNNEFNTTKEFTDTLKALDTNTIALNATNQLLAATVQSLVDKNWNVQLTQGANGMWSASGDMADQSNRAFSVPS